MAAHFLIKVTTLIIIASISTSYSEILLLPLRNSLSPISSHHTTTTAHHLLKSTSSRSSARHRRRRRQVSLPLSPGSDYTLSFSLGTSSPPQTLYMDTGSDLVWLPCHPFTCILCEGKPLPNNATSSPPPLDITSSVPVTCQSRACSSAHSSLPTSDLCAIASCPLDLIEMSDCQPYNCPRFYYAYADGSLIAKLYSDRLSIPMSSPMLGIGNFTFGCAHSSLGEPVGVAGFGRGELSLPAQLGTASPHLGKQFSYCLVSHSFEADRVSHPSPLILGRHSTDQKEKRVGGIGKGNDFSYTPMLNNPKHPYFYSVGLEAVSVGRKRVPAPESLKRVDELGNGGMVVDSGTTFTILPSGFYDSLVAEFGHRVGHGHARAHRVEEGTGLSPCYYIDDVARVPIVVLHFVGNSTVVLPRRNYFYEFLDGGDDGKGKRKVGCVMLMNGGDDEDEDGGGGGPVGTLGNYQQQGFEVVYDLEMGRVGFAKRECASLWDNLNQN